MNMEEIVNKQTAVELAVDAASIFDANGLDEISHILRKYSLEKKDMIQIQQLLNCICKKMANDISARRHNLSALQFWVSQQQQK